MITTSQKVFLTFLLASISIMGETRTRNQIPLTRLDIVDQPVLMVHRYELRYVIPKDYLYSVRRENQSRYLPIAISHADKNVLVPIIEKNPVKLRSLKAIIEQNTSKRFIVHGNRDISHGVDLESIAIEIEDNAYISLETLVHDRIFRSARTRFTSIVKANEALETALDRWDRVVSGKQAIRRRAVALADKILIETSMRSIIDGTFDAETWAKTLKRIKHIGLKKVALPAESDPETLHEKRTFFGYKEPEVILFSDTESTNGKFFAPGNSDGNGVFFGQLDLIHKWFYALRDAGYAVHFAHSKEETFRFLDTGNIVGFVSLNHGSPEASGGIDLQMLYNYRPHDGYHFVVLQSCNSNKAIEQPILTSPETMIKERIDPTRYLAYDGYMGTFFSFSTNALGGHLKDWKKWSKDPRYIYNVKLF